MDRASLRIAIDKHFNTNELKTLCFDLNISYENLEGDNKESKIRELISFCERLDKKTELSEAILRLRPSFRKMHFSDSSNLTPLSTKGDDKNNKSLNTSVAPDANDKEITAIKEWLLPRFANLVSGEVTHFGGISSSTPAQFNSFSFILKGRKTHYDSIGVMIRKFYAPSPSQHQRLWNIISTIPNPQHVGLKRIVFIVLSDYDYRFNLENLDYYEPGIDLIIGNVISHFGGGGHFKVRKKTSTG